MPVALSRSGFSTKPVQRHRRPTRIGCLAELQITVPRFGPIRGYTEGHKVLAFLDSPYSDRNGLMEGGFVRHDMVRRGNQHNRVGVACGKIQRSGQAPPARCCALRVQSGLGRGRFRFPQLLGNHKTESFVRQSQRLGIRGVGGALHPQGAHPAAGLSLQSVAQTVSDSFCGTAATGACRPRRKE